MTGRQPSEARKQYEMNRYYRRVDLEEFIDKMRHISNLEAAEYATSLLAFFDAIGGDPVEQALLLARTAIVDAMVDLGESQSKLNSIEIVVLQISNLTASSTSYNDNSALIRISDTLLAVVDMYSRHLTRGLIKESFVQSIRAILRRFRTGEVDLDVELLALSLRYNMIHQRTLNMAATPLLKLATMRQWHSDLFLSHCLRFIVAHEIAHHLLDAAAKDRAFMTASGVASCTGDQLLEIQADELALRSVFHAQKMERSGHVLHVALGVLVAIMVLECAESSLFINRGRTHPPARLRAELLLNLLPLRVSPSVQMFSAPLLRATSKASNFVLGKAPQMPWNRLRNDSDIVRFPYSQLSFGSILRWEEIQTSDSDALAHRVLLAAPTSGPISVGLSELRNQRLPEALVTWGASQTASRSAMDRTIPLTFYGLRNIIYSSPHLANFDDSKRTFLANSMSALVENELGKAVET